MDSVECGPDGLVRFEPPGRPIPGIAQTINELLAQRVRESADVVALVDRHRSLDYAHVASESAVAASVLHSLGVRPGDCVAVSLPNRIELATAFYAVQQLRAVWCGINTALTTDERVALLADSEAVVFLGTQSAAAGVAGRRADLPKLLHSMEFDDWVERASTANPVDPAVMNLPDDPWRPAGLA